MYYTKVFLALFVFSSSRHGCSNSVFDENANKHKLHKKTTEKYHFFIVSSLSVLLLGQFFLCLSAFQLRHHHQIANEEVEEMFWPRATLNDVNEKLCQYFSSLSLADPRSLIGGNALADRAFHFFVDVWSFFFRLSGSIVLLVTGYRYF